MGYLMGGHVRRKMSPDATLYVYDVYQPACDRFVKDYGKLGKIEIATSSKEVATKSKILISIVTKSENVEQVYLDQEHGVIAAPEDPDRLILECSTINIETTKKVGQAVMDAGRGIYVDSPVSGGAGGAAAGTIAFIVGHPGPPESDPLAKKIKDIVSWMGSPERVIFCGKLGSGLVGKIVNNYISCNTVATVAEAMAFGIRCGVDKMVLYNAIKSSSGDSWVMDNKQPVPGIIARSPASNNFKATFRSHMVLKDVGLGVEAAKSVGIKSTMGEAALKVFAQVNDDPRTSVSTPGYHAVSSKLSYSLFHLIELTFIVNRTSIVQPFGFILTVRWMRGLHHNRNENEKLLRVLSALNCNTHSPECLSYLGKKQFMTTVPHLFSYSNIVLVGMGCMIGNKCALPPNYIKNATSNSQPREKPSTAVFGQMYEVLFFEMCIFWSISTALAWPSS